MKLLSSLVVLSIVVDLALRDQETGRTSKSLKYVRAGNHLFQPIHKDREVSASSVVTARFEVWDKFSSLGFELALSAINRSITVSNNPEFVACRSSLSRNVWLFVSGVKSRCCTSKGCHPTLLGILLNKGSDWQTQFLLLHQQVKAAAQVCSCCLGWQGNLAGHVLKLTRATL